MATKQSLVKLLIVLILRFVFTCLKACSAQREFTVAARAWRDGRGVDGESFPF